MKDKIQALHDDILSSIENAGCVLITKSEHSALVAVAKAAADLLEEYDAAPVGLSGTKCGIVAELRAAIDFLRAGSEVTK
jgi:hypothetical protein